MYLGGNILEFNKDGYLDAGFHEVCIDELYEFFVKQFSTSQTREEIFNNFNRWRDSLIKQYNISEIWIDGSFVTNKINPNDIDVVVFAYAMNYENLYKRWRIIRQIDKLDAYLTVAICEENEKVLPPDLYYEYVNHRNYWRGQFGFDRNNSPKGVLVLKCDQKGITFKGGTTPCQ